MLRSPTLLWTDKIYSLIIKIGSNLQSLFLLYMRLVWGHQFLMAGLLKFSHIDTVAPFFASLNIPAPLFSAYLVAAVEAVCGFFLLIGFASRLAAIPLILVMLTALSTAHAPELSNFRFLFEPLALVQQEPYPFLITAVLVFVFGPGRVSIDAWLKHWIEHQPRY
jgi:putative oxidoreductase